jgi:hypothetical protein
MKAKASWSSHDESYRHLVPGKAAAAPRYCVSGPADSTLAKLLWLALAGREPRNMACTSHWPVTLCRQLRNYPCPPPQEAGAGPGPSTFDFKIDDSISNPFAPPQTVSCVGQHDANTSASVGISATYVKGDDSYKIKIGNDPLPPELLGAVDPQCPGPNPDGVGVLDVWDPPLLPPGAPSLSDWWSAASVTIGARTFATYSQIDLVLGEKRRPEQLRTEAGQWRNADMHGAWLLERHDGAAPGPRPVRRITGGISCSPAPAPPGDLGHGRISDQAGSCLG